MTEPANITEAPKNECKHCHAKDVPETAEKCPSCGCAMRIGPCNLCGKPIPKGATYCNECKSYQDKRQYFAFSATVLSLLTALVAVLTPAIKAVADYLDRHSQTSMMVRDVDRKAVYVYLWNTGQRPSKLAGAKLIFGKNIQIEDAELQPEEIGNTLIRRDLPILVRLRLRDALHLKPGATVQQVSEQLKKNDVQLQCYIDESNERHHPLDPEPLPYDGIHDFINEGLR